MTGPAPDAAQPARRERILDAAIAAFGEHGFGGATWRAIAERAGVTQGLIRFYFGDKEGLWRAAFRRAHDTRMDGMPPPAARPGEGPPDPVIVAAWIRAFTEHVARHPEEARMLVREGYAGSERMAWASDEVLREAHQAFFATVAILQEHGWFAGFEPRRLLYLLVGAAQYVFLVPGEVEAVSGEDARSDDYIARHAETVVRLFMAHAPSEAATA